MKGVRNFAVTKPIDKLTKDEAAWRYRALTLPYFRPAPSPIVPRSRCDNFGDAPSPKSPDDPLVLPYIPPSTVVVNKSATEADDSVFVQEGAGGGGAAADGGGVNNDGHHGNGAPRGDNSDDAEEQKKNGIEVRLAEPESTVVTSTAAVTQTHKRESGCLERCFHCMATVPCTATMAWAFIITTVSACGGALMVGVRRTRDFLDYSDDYMDYADAVCLGVLFGTILVATLCLIVSTVSSNPVSAAVFSTNKKNTCARVLNIITLLFMFLLHIGWLLCSVVLSVPVILLVLLHILYKDKGLDCIDLQNYGLSDSSKKYCSTELDNFYDESEDVLICYGIALVAAVLTVIGWTFFIMCATANLVHLKESRLSSYNVYRNDVNTSKNSVVDTRM